MKNFHARLINDNISSALWKLQHQNDAKQFPKDSLKEYGVGFISDKSNGSRNLSAASMAQAKDYHCSGSSVERLSSASGSSE